MLLQSEYLLTITKQQQQQKPQNNDSNPLQKTKQNMLRRKSNKHWQGCEEKGSLMSNQRTCKLIPPLWKTLEGSSKNITMQRSDDIFQGVP